MIPTWLHTLSIIMLGMGALFALIIIADEIRRPQKMWIMNLVWPICALFGNVIWLWLYFRYGQSHDGKRPYPASVALGTSHCGAGCTLGDIVAEWLGVIAPVTAGWMGWHWLFAEKMFAMWVLDYIFAYGFGIVFQYFTIAPMRNLGFAEGIKAAIKADTLSLTAWQVGMYGFMAIAVFAIFRPIFGVKIDPTMPEFWFMMQIAMICGFITSYPVNWWLIRSGIKEEM